jgi:glycosyltransferase involved in cell wall biosynthesis
VGGTNPALLQAMASGNCVVANGVDFNKEVIGDSGLWFEPGNDEDLKAKIEHLLDHPDETDRYRHLAVNRIEKYYNWDETADRTEKLMKALCNEK